MSAEDRMTADMSPRVVDTPQGFSSVPTRNIHHVELRHGRDLAGWVWAGDNSVGFIPDPEMVAYTAATGLVWTLADEVYRQRLPASAVLLGERYMDPWSVSPVVPGLPPA